MSVATVTARCVHCAWSTDVDDPEAVREQRDVHELVHPGGTVLVGEDAEKTRRGTPVVEHRSVRVSERWKPSAKANGKRTHWTRKSAIEAIQRFHVEHGRPPLSREVGRNGLPPIPTLRRFFGTFADAIVAAGFDRPQRGGRRPESAAVPPPEAVPDRAESGPGPHMAEGPPSLVESAQRVSELTERRRAMLAELDGIERELRSALAECESALRACAVEEAA